MGLSGSSGVLIMSVSAIVPEKSHGNKKCGEEEETERQNFCPFWHRSKYSKISVTWLFAPFLISICSLCPGQHADIIRRPT